MKFYTTAAIFSVLALTACDEHVGSYPAVSQADMDRVLAGVSCSSRSPGRSKPVAEYRDTDTSSGIFDLAGHPVRLCSGSQSIGTAVYWSGTNAAGNQLRAHATMPDGSFLHTMDGGYDSASGVNFIVVEFGASQTCRFEKPSGGIVPTAVARCEGV